ncbi:MAG TPA: GNAT family N-acetyltransferase [Sphingobacterium sp.]|nr:GNAT family N-acetyltransferase [Sphingobacterium sp.]
MEKHLPILETERLIIRPIQMDDAAYFFAMDSQPEVHTFLNNEPVQSIEEMKKAIAHIQQQYEKYGIGRLGVIEKSSNQWIGWTGFKYIDELENGRIGFLDLGYRFRTESWGKGYATEAALACMQYYSEQLTHFEVHAITHTANLGSRHVLEKVGFQVTEEFHFDLWNIPCYWYNLAIDQSTN